MNCKEIRDAALNGKTFTIKNVPIESIEFGDIQSCIDGLGRPVLFKTVNIKFVSPDIIDSVYSDNNDYPNIEVCEKPKHDPCRLFREGDRVKPRSVFGRKLYIKDVLYEVMWDESCNKISVKDLTSAETLVGMPSVFFELVTPVEELVPYYVEEQDPCYVVGKRQEAPEMEYVAGFSKTRHPNAKAAAEAERDRLNAEWRKEQTNE